VGVLTIVLGSVLGVLHPNKNNHVCGPLCGPDTILPDPNKEVFGITCKDWDFNAVTLPAPQGTDGTTCADTYDVVAYGCGCPGIEVRSAGCGTLCENGSDLPDPGLMVKDIHNQELSCQDWQLKAQFDTDPNECVNYNKAVGVLCGCSNDPHPDSCGPLCGANDGSSYSSFYHSGSHRIWDMRCDDWNTLSKSLPIWYNNDGGETCEEYYNDVAFGCACPGVQVSPPTCGALCQERRICSPICQAGESAIPDLNLIVRRETCQGWEIQSRLEVHSKVCPLYNMVGAQCGCDNTALTDACGPLCGPGQGSVPYPEREVQGETCASWNYMATFLSESYGKGEDGEGGIIESCSVHFSGIAYGCGCPGVEPPANVGCGSLCADGSSVPDPTKVVNARTCKDLELLSLFETDPKQCSRYEIFGLLCGCPVADSYNEECFELEHLMNETYYFSSGSLYSISFGDDGYFSQIQSNNDLFMVGRYIGIDKENAVFGGGAPCGIYGPRTGLVSIIEDDMVTEPSIARVIEPSVCLYHAVLKVPRFCNQTESSNRTIFK